MHLHIVFVVRPSFVFDQKFSVPSSSIDGLVNSWNILDIDPEKEDEAMVAELIYIARWSHLT